MDKYVLRRTILAVVREAEPAPAEMSDVLGHPKISMPVDDGTLTTAEAVDQVKQLAERGFLKNLRPGRTPLFRLTPQGRGQLTLDDPRSEFVWGQYASDFAE